MRERLSCLTTEPGYMPGKDKFSYAPRGIPGPTKDDNGAGIAGTIDK